MRKGYRELCAFQKLFMVTTLFSDRECRNAVAVAIGKKNTIPSHTCPKIRISPSHCLFMCLKMLDEWQKVDPDQMTRSVVSALGLHW